MNYITTAFISIGVFFSLVIGAQTPLNNELDIPVSKNKRCFATSIDVAANAAQNAIDNSTATSWVSKAPLPDGFIPRTDQNIVLQQANLGAVSSTSSNVLTNTNDGKVTTQTTINATSGKRWWRYTFSKTQSLRSLSLRCEITGGLIDVYVKLKTDSLYKLGTYGQSENYSLKRFNYITEIKEIYIESAIDFKINEVAALSKIPEEMIVLDLDSIYTIEKIYVGLGATNLSFAKIEASIDSSKWYLIQEVSPTSYLYVPYLSKPRFHVRYIRVRQGLPEQNWAKAGVSEISVYRYKDVENLNWNSNIGVVKPISNNCNISATSIAAAANNASMAIDQKSTTSWMSTPPFPSNFITKPTQNCLHQQNNIGIVSSSSANPLSNTIDGNINNYSTITTTSSTFWWKYSFHNPLSINTLSVKCENPSGGKVDLFAVLYNDSIVKLGEYLAANNYSTKRFAINNSIKELFFSSVNGFKLYEVAAFNTLPQESITLNFDSVRQISAIDVTLGIFSITDATVAYSVDGQNWVTARKLNPAVFQKVPIHFVPEIEARYIRISQTIKALDWAKAGVQEIAVYDQNGQFGKMPTLAPSKPTIFDLMGVNGIWGWGYNKYSTLLTQNQGPWRFAKLGKNARNYHEMSWDVTDPDNIPNYEVLGGLAQWWLDWDVEYQVWKDAGFNINAAIQFGVHGQQQSTWNNPYAAAYNYGYAFARHFGPTYGNGLITALEVGNEPWLYDSTFYNTVLKGMSRGVKAADSALQVFSCALQAADPSAEQKYYKNYMGARIKPNDAPYLDGINVHHYTFINDSNGVKRLTYPENKNCDMMSLLADIRFRDQNMPGKKMIVTEWGWDSDGADENCTHNECVNERAQAIYGVRGLLMMNRLGIDNASWYNFSNTAGGSSMFTRSGLVSSPETGFLPKASFRACEAVVRHIGDKKVVAIVSENRDGWVYLLGDDNGTITHIAGWLPTEESDTMIKQITFASNLLPDSAFFIDGANSYGTPTQNPLYNNQNGEITMQLSTVPTIVKCLPPSAYKQRKMEKTEEVNIEKTVPFTVSISPNPSVMMPRITLFGNENSVVSARIIDTHGSEILRMQKVSINNGRAQIEMNHKTISKGIYFVELQIFDSTTEKVSMQREKFVIF